MPGEQQRTRKEKMVHLIRKRILSSVVDFYLFALMVSLFLYIVGLTEIKSALISVVALIVAFIVYFGVIVKVSDGYTLGGFLFKVKIITIDYSKLEILSLIKRAFVGIGMYITSCSFRCTRFNTLGQFKFDEKFGTTVVDGREKNPFLDRNEIGYYHYDFLKSF